MLQMPFDILFDMLHASCSKNINLQKAKADSVVLMLRLSKTETWKYKGVHCRQSTRSLTSGLTALDHDLKVNIQTLTLASLPY